MDKSKVAHFYSICKLLVASLLLGLLGPTTVSTSTANASLTGVTKKFFVKGSNGSPLSQALVQIFWYDEFGQLNSSDAATTGDDGIAQVLLPSESPGFGQFVVVPALGDTANAIAFSEDLDLAELAESTTVTLNTPSIFVEIQDVDGTPVYSSPGDLYNSLLLRGTTLQRQTFLPRSGAFGVALQDLNPQETYSVRLLHFGDKNRTTQSRYTLRAIDPGQNQFTIFDGPTADGPPKPGMPTLSPVGGVYKLKYRVPNLRLAGVIPGETTTLSGSYFYSIRKSGSGTPLAGFSANYGNPINFSVETGSYVATIEPIGPNETYTATSFEFTVANGIPNLPGNIQTIDQISYVPLALNNFRFKIVGLDSTLRKEGFLDYCKLKLENGEYGIDQLTCSGFGVDENTGVGGERLADGAYVFLARPGHGVLEAPTKYLVGVQSGIATLLNESMTPISATKDSSGRFVFSTQQANVHVYVRGPNNETITFPYNEDKSLDFILLKQDDNGFYDEVNLFSKSPSFAFKIEESGTYKIAVNPYGLSDWKCTVSPAFSYSGTAFNLHATFTSLASLTQTNTVLIKLSSSNTCGFGQGGSNGDSQQDGNFKFKLTHPASSTALSGRVTVFKCDQYGCWNWQAEQGTSVNGEGAVNVSTATSGTFRIRVNADGYASNYYDLVVEGGNFVVSQKLNLISLTDGRYGLNPAAANIAGQVKRENGQVVLPDNQSGKWLNINLQKLDEFGNWQWVDESSAEVDSSGTFRIAWSETGTYRVRVEPQGYSDLGEAYGDSFTVIAGDPVTFNNGVSSVPNLINSNALSVVIKPSNLRVKIVKPGTNEAVSWGNVCLQKEDPVGSGFFTWLGQCVFANQGLGGTSLAAGSYRLEVNVDGYARKNYFAIIPANSESSVVIKDDKNVNASIDTVTGRFILSPAQANITGRVVGASGETLTLGGMNQWVSVSLQKKQEGEWWQWLEGSGTDSSGNFTFSASSPGTYRVEAQPGSGLSNLAPGKSVEFYYNGSTFTVGSSDKGTELAGSDALVINLSQPNFKVKLVDPSNPSTVITQGWVNVSQQLAMGGSQWVGNINIFGNEGTGGISLAAGTYQLDVNSNASGYARSFYTLVVAPDTVTLYAGGVVDASKKVNADGSGVFLISPGKPNVTGRIFDKNSKPLGSANNKWVNINVQKYNTLFGDWEWTQNFANTNFDGRFSINISETGTFRLRIEPNGYSDVSTSYSDSFTLTAINETKDFPTIKLGAPTLTIKVDLSSAPLTALNFIGIEVRQDNQWIDWTGTGPSGSAGITLKDAGEYQLVLHPSPTQIAAGAARKTYDVVATKDSNGNITATVSGGNLVGDVYWLTLGSGNVKGTVVFGSGGSKVSVANVSVVAREVGSMRELWEYGAQSGSNGAWSMNLPAGKYTIVAIPWGSNNYGKSANSAEVTVISSDSATVAGGVSASAIELTLSSPTWKGTIKNSSDTPVAFAGISLVNDGIWYGTNADANGNFALSIPGHTSGFTFSSDAFLEIRDDRTGALPMRRWQGSAEVSSVLNPSGSDSVTLKFAGANFTVNVTAGGQPASNVWVNVDADNVGWLGGNRTNALGQAKLTIDTNTIGTGVNVRIRADVGGNSTLSANYSSVQTSVARIDVVNAINAGSYSITLDLTSPSLRGELRETESGKVVSWAWVELFRESTGEWLQGTNTDQNGLFSLAVSEYDTYTLTVNPSWNSNAEVSKNQYRVVHNASSTKIYASGVEVAQTTVKGKSYSKLSLGTPSLKGKVLKSDGSAVRDSWVVPINKDTGEYLWQKGTNSKSDGAFALSLTKGTYLLEANVPWNSSNLAKSSPCSVTISDAGTVTSTTCSQVGGSLQLELRSPNLTMTLQKPGGSAALAYSWVSVCVERFCTGGQSDRDGKVAIFIDKAAINQANGFSGTDTTTRDISIFVNPPWGSSDVAPYSCQSSKDQDNSKIICGAIPDYTADISTAYPNTAVGTVALAGPNLSLTVNKPAGGALANSWVNLFSSTGNWLGGSNTDSTGKASFNVTDTQSVTFRVEINPPWNETTKYTRKVVEGLSFAQVNDQVFTLDAPNLTVSVKTATNVANKWGWINLEESGTSSMTPVGGYGLDGSGQTSLNLAKGKTYKVTVYPGPGAKGAVSSCLVKMDSPTAEIETITSCTDGSFDNTTDLLELKLGSGNFIGVVKIDNGVAGSTGDSRVAGAVIIASASGQEDVKTVTASDGEFKLYLEPSATWTIKVIPVQSVDGVTLLTESFVFTSSDIQAGGTKDLSVGITS